MSEKDPDLLLDAALRSYADPGPNSGLEQRILQRIAERVPIGVEHSWRKRLLWAAGFAFAAASLWPVFFSAPRLKNARPVATPPQTLVEQPPMPRPEATNAPRPTLAAQVHRKKTAPHPMPQPGPRPKLAVFPTPTPLSPQERALAEFISRASTEQQKDLIVAQRKADAPLHIAAISIPFLEPSEKDPEKDKE